MYNQLIQWNKSQDGFFFNLLLLLIAIFFHSRSFLSSNRPANAIFFSQNMANKIIHYISRENKGSIKWISCGLPQMPTKKLKQIHLHRHTSGEKEREERKKTNYIFVEDMIFYFCFLRKVHVKVEEFSSWLCKK